ncbi:glycerophosphodiester phosphodiesterase family protein [Govanella unica]|uniref:GP-PDE domain-containing protein n=1 Tax=Govanella unica TaxID=2975056 RepID=A0A9X3TW95_9PROT|nr:glycerophosphodiester phosphodiesterase family protein [Govania unica]MDA5192818.1 hypothetical protein [Govania unica]
MLLKLFICSERPFSSLTQRLHTAFSMSCFLFLLLITSLPAQANKYEARPSPDKELLWQGKFRYGAYSSLISSHVMGTKFHHLIVELSKPLPLDEVGRNKKIGELRIGIKEFKDAYEGLKEEEIDNIIKYAKEDRTESVYEEERSVVASVKQNDVFIEGMKSHAGLAPVDRLIQDNKFISDNFQFNTHRGLYNNAYGIPQNSLAAIVNAYVVGIRSVEFDVLSTKDHVSIVIHELTTNSTTGNYNDGPVKVQDLNFDDIKATKIDILNPIGPNPDVEKTGIVNIMRTDDVLAVVHELMPEMTLYIDSRNDAPIALIKLIGEQPKYRDHVVLKIYPFLLHGGVEDLVVNYAKQTRLDLEAARKKIREIRPNVLLASGNAESESNGDVQINEIKAFGWHDFKKHTKDLPFSTDSAIGIENYKTASFTPNELQDIERQTYQMFLWTMGFSDITNVLIYQMSAIPSLTLLLKANNKTEIFLMGRQNVIKGAVQDNFMKLYEKVMGDKLNLVIGAQAETYALKKLIENARFGLSDRYQDLTVAGRLGEDDSYIDQLSICGFIINMGGTIEASNSYGYSKMQSTKAMVDRAKELNSSFVKVVYATTDLPEDLRLAFMGALGKHGFPSDIRYRPSSLIKEKYMKGLASEFKLPDWTKRLYKVAEGNGGEFDKAYAEYTALKKEVEEEEKKRYALTQARAERAPLLKREFLDLFKLKPGYNIKDYPDMKGDLDIYINKIKVDIDSLKEKVKGKDDHVSGVYNCRLK